MPPAHTLFPPGTPRLADSTMDQRLREFELNGFDALDAVAALQHCGGDMDAALAFAVQVWGGGGGAPGILLSCLRG